MPRQLPIVLRFHTPLKSDHCKTQTFAISAEGCDEGQKKLVEAFCRNVSEVNWGEQLELSESINIPIVQELLLVLFHTPLKSDHCKTSDWHCLSLDVTERHTKDGKTVPVHIGRNAFIGTRCIILKGVTIGENAIIGAGSVVTSDIPDNAIAAGNPCRIIKSS